MFRDFLLRHLPVEELSSSFADGVGRPSKDLFMAWRALILQQLHNQTDREIIESVSLNIAWQYPWLNPLTEPLRQDAWDVPLSQWESHPEIAAQIPELKTGATP